MTLAIDPRDPQLQSQNQEQHVSVLKFPVLLIEIKIVASEIFWEASPGFSNINKSTDQKNMSHTTYSGENVVCDNVVVYLYLLINELKVHTSRSRKMHR